MSTSKLRAETQFQIIVNSPPGSDPEDVKVIIYDGWDHLVHEGLGSADLILPVGLYTIRWQYADEVGERVVRLPYEGPFQLTIQRHSAAPFPGTVNSHEYYEYTSAAFRKQNTGAVLGEFKAETQSSLFLFIRAQSQESYAGEDLAKDLVVVGKGGQKFFDLAERSKQDNTFGCLACSLPAAPGLYFLEDRGKQPRDFPLLIYPNWQTQVYIMYYRGRPLLEGASVSFSHSDVDLSSQTRINAAADAALSALQNNLTPLPKEIEQGLLYRKFDNPLLGLIGLHSYLDRAAADPNVVQLVLDNLHGLIESSIDLKALEFKATVRFTDNPAFSIPEAIQEPPLLRASVEALLEANNAAGVNAIAKGSLFEHLLPFLAFDSVWATWRLTSDTQEGVRSAIRNANKDAVSQYSFGTSSLDEENWLRNSVIDLLQQTEKTSRTPNWSKFASSLGVARRTVDKILEDLGRS